MILQYFLYSFSFKGISFVLFRHLCYFWSKLFFCPKMNKTVIFKSYNWPISKLHLFLFISSGVIYWFRCHEYGAKQIYSKMNPLWAKIFFYFHNNNINKIIIIITSTAAESTRRKTVLWKEKEEHGIRPHVGKQTIVTTIM